jgi:hypothetical protein
MIKVTIYYYSEYYRKLKLLLGQIINARSGHIKVALHLSGILVSRALTAARTLQVKLGGTVTPDDRRKRIPMKITQASRRSTS